jgi:hypothetical protein
LYDATDLTFDVVNDYPWTLSRNKEALRETPYILLKEFVINESVIKQQISFYTTAFNNSTERVEDAAFGQLARGSTNPLSPYDNLYPGTPNGNLYTFPYFSDINFEVNTPVWQTLDAIETGKKAGTGIMGTLFGQSAAQNTEKILDFVGAAYTAGLATQYPKVGIMDRPRLWERHEFRTIEIKFPLFNTIGPRDWEANRRLCWILVNQNLFRKRDFITGVPPVYYEVLIPGQHYSIAACVTNITIFNRGNMRNLSDKNGISVLVPDVYEVNITLTDMTMPSRNLFQAVNLKSREVNVKFIENAPRPETPILGRGANTAVNVVGRTILGAGNIVVDLARGGINAGRSLVGGVTNIFTDINNTN